MSTQTCWHVISVEINLVCIEKSGLTFNRFCLAVNQEIFSLFRCPTLDVNGHTLMCCSLNHPHIAEAIRSHSSGGHPLQDFSGFGQAANHCTSSKEVVEGDNVGLQWGSVDLFQKDLRSVVDNSPSKSTTSVATCHHFLLKQKKLGPCYFSPPGQLPDLLRWHRPSASHCTTARWGESLPLPLDEKSCWLAVHEKSSTRRWWWCQRSLHLLDIPSASFPSSVLGVLQLGHVWPKLPAVPGTDVSWESSDVVILPEHPGRPLRSPAVGRQMRPKIQSEAWHFELRLQ